MFLILGIRTDIASESKILKEKIPNGVSQNIKTFNGVKVIEIQIKNEIGSKILNRAIGTYITLEHSNMLLPENAEIITKILVNELKYFISNKKSILVVGLGNKNISPDAIGPFVADKIIATRHLKGPLADELGLSKLNSISVIAPGVLGQTGIETFEIIQSISKKINPDLIIAIDALAAKSIDRLGTTIQITNTGISPGSGVENKRAEISKNTLNIPVIALGMPTVVDMETIISEMCPKQHLSASSSMMVTPRNIDQIISRSSSLISNSINQALFPSLSPKEISSLAS